MVDSVTSSNSLRVGGLASGIDTDSLVEQLMNAERQKLYKLQQQQTTLEWQQDAYREVNTSLSAFEESMTNMKLSTTYNAKTTSSTSSAVTATADSSSSAGSYSIEVRQVATSAINLSSARIGTDASFNPYESIGSQAFANGQNISDEDLSFSFTTYDELGNEVEHSFSFTTEDSLDDILKEITDSDAGVRAFYDTQSGKVVMEKKNTGDYNMDEYDADGNLIKNAEIEFDTSNTFFTSFLNMDSANESGGTSALITYNGVLDVASYENSYKLNGITFNWTDTTEGPAKVSVNSDVDSTYDKIKQFVDTYNGLIESINSKLDETKYRDYAPLTSAQKEEMSDDEIELWEEKAKSGLLKGDSVLSNVLSSMRSDWYSSVDSSGSFNLLSQIGIEPSNDYTENGKLIIDEDKLKDALQNDPESVYKLFSNSSEDSSRGIINKLEDTVNKAMDSIYQKAGKSTYTNEQFTIGKSLNDIEDRIDAYQDYLTQVEDRYWSQFSAMETAISQMNQQSAYLTSNFG